MSQTFKAFSGVESFCFEGPSGEESGNFPYEDVIAIKIGNDVFLCHGVEGEPLIVEKVLTTQAMPTEHEFTVFDDEQEDESDDEPAIGDPAEEEDDDDDDDDGGDPDDGEQLKVA